MTYLTPFFKKQKLQTLPITLKLDGKRFISPQNRESIKSNNSVGWLSYQMGNMLNVKPIIQCYKGHAEPVDKAMGFDKNSVKLFNDAKSATENNLSTNVIVISYAGDLNDVYNEHNSISKMLARGHSH